MSTVISDFLCDGMTNIADGTATMYRSKAGHLGRLLGTVDARRLSYEDVLGYVNTRTRDEGARRETVKKELITLRRALKLATQRGDGVADHRLVIPTVKTDYVPRDRWLTEVEYLALLDALPDHRRDYVRVAVYTGARKSELERLTWAEVDLKGGWIRIPGKKTERARRHIPIEAPLRRALETMPHRKGPLLALWGDIGHELPEAAIRAGMRPVTTNDLRRTFTSWALQNGANPFEVARLLGHASTKMVETVYGHLAARNLVRVVRRLPDPEGRTNNVRDSSGLKRKRKGS